MSEDQKKSFKDLSTGEQMEILYDMLAYVRGEIAGTKKVQIIMKDEFENFQREARAYRGQREKKEITHESEIGNTTQKIIKVYAQEMAKRFDFWSWARDRILPTILTAIILGVLYLVFGGRLP